MFPQSEYPKRELRGTWIATVANIDWPLSRSSSTDEKIAELKSMLTRLHDMGINTVFFQIRTECDALYDSSIEPWSYWLTGKQGTPPSPFFDPLEIAITESHKLGMELHAWFNPYRCIKSLNNYEIAENHVSVQHPDWLIAFKDYKMIDPGNPAVTPYITSVVEDVLTRYDVDGIHFDDYFYPYEPKITNEDAATFSKYSRGYSNIENWRRDNINQLMKQVSELIRTKKPRVKFGVSPFGIVENKYAGTNGSGSYRTIYCDPLNWIGNKLVDYVIPQIYWEIGHPKADFAKLLPWWASVTKDCQFYAGLYSSNFLGKKHAGLPNEIPEQIRLVRKTDNAFGSVFFSAKSLLNNKDMADSLSLKFYLYPAIVPAMASKDTVPPNTPENGTSTFEDNIITLKWEKPAMAPDGETASKYVIYRFGRYERINMDDVRAMRQIVSAGASVYSEKIYTAPDSYVYVISALDRLNNESLEHLIIRP